MFKLFFILTLCSIYLASSPIASSSEIDRVKHIYTVITDFRFPISDKDAKIIAKALNKAQDSPGCRISWDTLLAVAIQESRLNRSAKGPKNENGTVDRGLMQFNSKTIEGMKLNKNRLVNDISYSIQSACKLLTDNKRIYSRRTPYWIGTYNAGVNLKKDVVKRNIKKYHDKINTIKSVIHKKAHKLLLAEG